MMQLKIVPEDRHMIISEATEVRVLFDREVVEVWSPRAGLWACVGVPYEELRSFIAALKSAQCLLEEQREKYEN